MTLKTIWSFPEMYGRKAFAPEQPNSPLVEKWIKLLSLEDIPIQIIHEHESGSVRTRFHYEKGCWFISTNGCLDDHTLLHKLGYLWNWKRMGVFEEQKEWKKKDAIHCLVESCIMDNIIWYQFYNMDIDFKAWWLGDTIKYTKHWYCGGTWYSALPLMFFTYISHYLRYFYVLPGENQNELSNYILYELDKRRAEILEKCQISHINFTKKDFRLLHKLLRKFNKILNFNTYTDIEDYLTKIKYFYHKVIGVRFEKTK